LDQRTAGQYQASRDKQTGADQHRSGREDKGAHKQRDDGAGKNGNA